MLTERSIINFLVWVGGLILGPYLAVCAVEFNFVPILVVAGVCLCAIVFGALRDRMCLLPLIGANYSGHFTFLPLKIATSDVCALATIAYFFITYFALQRKKIQTGPMIFFLPILVIGAIIFYHDHNFGLRSLGNGREGARGSVFVLVAVLTYLAGASINGPSPRFLFWTPLFCLLASVLSAIPYTITTYLPSTAGYFYLITDNINSSAYSAMSTDGIVRNQAQANVGSALTIFLLCYYPIDTWLRPTRLWIPFVCLGCVGLVVMGGFRSGLVNFALMAFTAIWCHSAWRALAILPVIVLGIFIATALQSSQLVTLPDAAQRSLAFLPGNWDPDVIDSTKSSNEFRDRIRDVYLKEEAGNSPILGNGLSFDTTEFERLNNLALVHETPDGYYSTKAFVIGKMFHSGWISLYDAMGVSGFIAFLTLILGLVWKSGSLIFSRKSDDRDNPLFPLKVWMFCNLFGTAVGYFTVFGDFKFAFPSYCYFAILWIHINRVEQRGYPLVAQSSPLRFDPSRSAMALPA